MRLNFTLSFLLLVQFGFTQYVLVLGIAQDGGFPHIGCQKECQLAYESPEMSRFVTSLALVDPENKKWWLFEATPDMDDQLQYFQELTDNAYPYLPEGIFITHAHIGHYTGLMSLGREALGAKGVKVYALPRMIEYLKSNGPWSQLDLLGNIEPIAMTQSEEVELNNVLSVEAFTVPHRDEFSETAGFRINNKQDSYLFIPDIDKWSKWDKDIIDVIKDPEIKSAFLDATFYADGELPNRAMSEVPHPFVAETMDLFKNESSAIKQKIVFIHLNHTNPLLFDPETQEQVRKMGFKIAKQGVLYR